MLPFALHGRPWSVDGLFGSWASSAPRSSALKLSRSPGFFPERKVRNRSRNCRRSLAVVGSCHRCRRSQSLQARTGRSSWRGGGFGTGGGETAATLSARGKANLRRPSFSLRQDTVQQQARMVFSASLMLPASRSPAPSLRGRAFARRWLNGASRSRTVAGAETCPCGPARTDARHDVGHPPAGRASWS